MEEPENGPILSRKELRRQKLMEYLAAKGKLKMPNPKPYLRVDCQVKKPVISALKSAKGKENKTPAAVGLNNESTKIRLHMAQSTSQPSRRVCGVSKVSVEGGIPMGQRNVCRPTAPKVQLQRKLHEKPVLTRTYTLVSKPNSQFKKLQNTGGKSLSNAPHPAVTQPNSRSISCTSAAQSAPKSTVCGRISLGPLVKTKTGLIPAAIQPRNTKSNLACSSARTVDAIPSLANLGHTSTAVSQRPFAVRRKTFSTRSVYKPVHERITTTFTTRAEVQDQTKSTKQVPIKPPKPLTTGLKPKVVSSKCTAPPVNPDGKERTLKTVKSVVQPSNKSAQRRSQAEPAATGQTFRVASRTSAIPINSSRAVSRVTQATVAKPGGNAKICKGTSANILPPQAGTKRTGIPVMSQTVPRPVRTVSQLGRTIDMKTPKASVKVPQTEGKKPTAAQEERMRKLREWREAKGISYKRPPMPVKPQVRHTVALPQTFWTAMKEEEDAHSLISAVDRSLADCIKLLKEGCPTDQVKEVLSRLPAVSQKFAKYWICQARLMEQEGNLEVLPMFEEAVRVVLEPVDELRTVVFEILKRKDKIQVSIEEEKEDAQSRGTVESCPKESVNPLMTPKPVRAFICGEKGDSSMVKYKITATPGNPKSQRKEPARVNGQEVRFFTPVRRSIRIERASLHYPASLQDHDLCVTSYSDLIAEEERGKNEEQEEASSSVHNTPVYIYRQNEALKDKVFVELVCDDVNKVLNLE